MEKELKYPRISMRQFLVGVNTEAKARRLAWKIKYGGEEFLCPHCGKKEFWELKSRPEIRQCTSCKFQVRLRVGTLFENSKLPLLVWMQALLFMMQGKRGLSALELQRLLALTRYQTAWSMLMKIRKALMDRDSMYKLKGIVELDGAVFGKKDFYKKKDSSKSVFIGVETKQWVDDKGQPKTRAGFAQVYVDPYGQETRQGAVDFITQSIKPRSTIKTDGRSMYRNMPNVKSNSKSVSGVRELVDALLPWVHKFISNAKTWVLGTQHGIKDTHKYLKYYLAEYTYRFNRRHDPNSLFHRSLSACLTAKPISLDALCG
jgi:predicted RNA-binding Zn-ribbon protein involved in translation (DUF1610 family)